MILDSEWFPGMLFGRVALFKIKVLVHKIITSLFLLRSLYCKRHLTCVQHRFELALHSDGVRLPSAVPRAYHLLFDKSHDRRVNRLDLFDSLGTREVEIVERLGLLCLLNDLREV